MESDMFKDYSYSEGEEFHCSHYMGYSFQLEQGFYMHHPTDKIAYTTTFVTPDVALWNNQSKEGNVLFNDTLNTFTVIWCQTYGKEPLG